MNIRQWIGRAALLAAALLAGLLLPAANATDFLDPEDAFKFSAAISDDGGAVEARFSIADGYYLYRERFGFSASDGVQLGMPQFPPGKIKFDETFNKELEIYRGNVVVRLPIEAAGGPFTLTARLQGCADQGLCYPPDVRVARLVLGAPSGGHAPDRRRAIGQRPVDDTNGRRAYRNRVEIPITPHGAADLFRARPALELHALRAADGPDSVVDRRRAGW